MINIINHTLNMDLANKINMNSPINIKKNDTNSHKFIINLFNNSASHDLTGTTSRIYFKKPDGTKVFLSCVLDGSINNKLSVLLTTQALTAIGSVACEITIYGTSGEIQTSFTFNFNVLENIRDDEAIESTNDFTALTDALAVVTTIANKADKSYTDAQLLLKADETNLTITNNNVANNVVDIASNAAELAEKAQQYINSYTGKNRVKFIAHRGLSSCAPENTIPSYEMAGKAGLWGAECDIQTTSDGVWILMHDTTVDRTTNGTGNVYDLTLAQIKALVVDGGNAVAKYPNLRVPTLEEYLLTCKKFDIVPVIEIKSQAYTSTNYDDLLAIIRSSGFEENAIFISFDYGILQEARNRSKNVMVQFLATLTPGAIDAVLALGNAAVDVSAVTKADVEYAHSKGVMVNVWTINDYQIAKTYVGYGVDFITTDQIGGVI